MHAPVTVQLPPELEPIRQKWAVAAKGEHEVIYSREFGPAFAPLFANLPLDGLGSDRPRFRALVSVLGLSWQPVALMAAWADPEVVLVLGTDESFSVRIDGEPIREIIPRVSGRNRAKFSFQRVSESDELLIYREVRSFLESRGIGPHEVAIDPTGGKKSMSVSAALAGFLSGAWIVYVDYARYNADKRIPEAGTEYPRLLRNPLEVYGELEFDRVKNAFRGGSYEEASHLANALAARLYEPREAEALSLLSAAYGSWHRFDFLEAAEKCGKLYALLEKFARLGKWEWGAKVLQRMQIQRDTIQTLADLASRIDGGERPKTIGDGLPLVFNHLASAERYLSFHQLGVAILLAYASLERYVDLCLWVKYGLDDSKADFTGVPLDTAKYHRVGRDFHGKKYQERDLPDQISLATGVQLLATLEPGLLPSKIFFGPILGLMNDRNKCEFEHGIRTKTICHSEAARHLETVKKILAITFQEQGNDIEIELEQYRFPSI